MKGVNRVQIKYMVFIDQVDSLLTDGLIVWLAFYVIYMIAETLDGKAKP